MTLPPDAALLWADYQRETGNTERLRGVDSFGDSPAMADELLGLVMAGTKRATCGLARDFADDPLRPGDHWIIVDGRGEARCILRTVSVTPTPIREVDAAFARLEGEGDLSLDWWKREHDAYFTRQGAREGFVYDDAMTGLCEVFERVWPLEG